MSLKPCSLTLDQKTKIAKELNPITHDKAVADFQALRSVDLDKIKPLSRIGNKVVDYFTYTERLNTQGNKGVSYFELLENADYFREKPYIQKVLEYFKKTRPHNSAERVWRLVLTLYFSNVAIYKPLNAMGIYKQFSPKSVLDFTMGWGGRLVGACALDIPNYIGIDLNKNLEDPYKEMVAMLAPMTKTNIKLFFSDALSIDYSKLDYDMVFTSPPYYNTETYTGTPTLTKEEWKNNFYKPIFEKTWKYLKKGGHFIINVPADIYKDVLVPLFGEATTIIPFVKRQRQKGSGKDYKEGIYVWVRG